MDLTLQPKPEVEITKADKGIISKTQYFVEKKYETITQYCFPVHLIRNWKPKVQLLYPSVPNESAIQYECDFNRNVQNFFVEDNAEEVFLRTPPPCFVIIGKSDVSTYRLGRKIANEYGSVLINVDDIFNQVLYTDTKTSKLLHNVLRLGFSLSLRFIMPLLSFLAHTAEARHRGYVLCGLPIKPDPLGLPAEQQFNYLFTWENKPTIFINVLFEDEDFIKERNKLRYEIKNGEKGKLIMIHTQSDDLSDEEDEIENPDQKFLLPIKEKTSNVDINISPSRQWLTFPKDEESVLGSELEQFNMHVKPVIDLIASRIDPQYFITVDARVENEFEMVVARLSLLQIWKSPVAFPFLTEEQKKKTSKNDEVESVDIESVYESEDPEILRAAEEPPQIAFLTLFHKKTISPKFRWELSHYNYICPVSLREMQIVEGKSEYAVGFMKYIYFLRDKKCMEKFLANPRAYVLPIRPKPAYRIIILGHPFTGKTALAKNLTEEFSLTYLDFHTILINDIDTKKKIYEKFCKEKAECREILRLTNQSWKEWRVEEEQRESLIEEWIMYIQNLLSQRINQFYYPETLEKETKEYFPSESDGIIDIQPEDDAMSTESKQPEGKRVRLQGVPISSIDFYEREQTPVDDHSSPSVKIIHAMKHSDFDFNENGREVEANLFFSSLWNTFSKKTHKSLRKSSVEGEGDEEGEIQRNRDSVTIDWFTLLPPQSLSTLLMKQKPYTIREKRQSFQILLEAASKNYWSEDTLKIEFAKWRLPCFMDIPLCEIFLDNPVLLLKYIPEWLKERPAFPKPIDFSHPKVVEAGERALTRASIVKIGHSKEEIGILLRNAMEKAERERMRVTGEIISPGGWVLDNMTLDIDVWKKLVCDNAFADHIYVLTESDERKIITKWCKLISPSSEISVRKAHVHSIDDQENISSASSEKELSDSDSVNYYKINLQQILKDSMQHNDHYEEEIDEIFDALQNDTEIDRLELQLDPFCDALVYKHAKTFGLSKTESMHDDLVTGHLGQSESNHIFSTTRQISNLYSNFFLGTKLQIFTEKLLQLLETPQLRDEKENTQEIKSKVEFFMNFLSFPKKIDQITRLLSSAHQEDTIRNVDVTDKSPQKLFQEIKNELLKPFIKKPRELEEFEKQEILRWTYRKSENAEENEEENEEDIAREETEEGEDIRIFGESGSLDIVHLERNIFLMGKPEFALRYYGKLYYFNNEESKNKFIEDPEKYAPYYSPIRCYPPLRIFVTGPIASGKTKLCHAVAEQLSINYVDYLTLLNKTLIPHLPEPLAKFTALNDHPLLLKEGYNASAKAVKEKFMNAPFSYRTQWLENPFYSTGDSYKDVFSTIKLSSRAALNNLPQLNYEIIEPHEEFHAMLKEYDASAQTTFFSMKETEQIINKYIQNVDDLNDYCVEKSLKKLWNLFPYTTEGFVIEGFPMRAFDVQRILENTWLPDLIIDLTLPESAIIDNNIDSLMEQWDAKLQQETVEERLLEDALEMIQRSCRWSRKDELFAEMVENNTINFKNSEEQDKTEESNEEKLILMQDSDLQLKSKTSSRSDETLSMSPEVEAKIFNEIEQILDKEFPPMEFNTVYETYEAGRERVINDLLANYRRDVEEISKIKELLKDVEIEWLQINSDKDFDSNLNKIFIILDKLKKGADRKGEFAFTMSMEMADILLKQGYYFLSKFGRWCPVQIYRLKNSIHMFRPLNSRKKVVPIAYRNYIYFVAGENEKKIFLQDPLKYIFNEPHHPIIPVRVAVIGPPKSGKSTLCKRLGAMFGLKVITMGTALRFVIEKIPNSTLAKNINCYLRRGCFLPLSIKIEALMASLNDPDCVSQGFVLDGIPYDAALTQTLAERNKLPFVIISLISDTNFGKINRQNLDLSQFRLPYKNRVNLEMKYKDWNGTYKKFSQWNHSTYRNLYELNSKLNIVDIFYQSYDIIRKSVFGILYYVENCVKDKVLPLQYLCVSNQEYELRKSFLESNCPVCWADLKKLNPSSYPLEYSGLVQYLENFYWVCPNHMEKFIKTPKAYFPPFAEECPRFLPRIITKEMYEAMSPSPKIHGYGRCPVTRVDFPSRLDWEGSWDFAAFYINKVYLCKNKDLLERFLAQPWNYTQANTIFEVNRHEKSRALVELRPPPLNMLPPVGFLEQTVSYLITEAVRIVGAIRPVYPDLPLETMGCVFLGLVLVCENAKSKYRAIAKEKLLFMILNYKASNYGFKSIKLKEEEMEKGRLETDEFQELDISDSDDDIYDDSNDIEEKNLCEVKNWSISYTSFDSCWLDVDSRLHKQMWSAHNSKLDKTKMKFTSEDELEEIPEVPKVYVILRYQMCDIRPSPFPPISNCISYIYSVSPNMQLPEPFNYNSLHQPLPQFSSPYSNTLVYNPKKEFAISLFEESQPDYHSKENLLRSPRAHSVKSIPEFKKAENENGTFNLKFITENLLPRFQILDRIPQPAPLPLPKVKDDQIMFYNPQRDHTYMMLYGEFFHMSHFLRCYEWTTLLSHLELHSRLDKNLGMLPPGPNILRRPTKRRSVELKRPVDYYQDIFDACAKFVSYPQEEEPEDETLADVNMTLEAFIQMLLWDKIEEIFTQVYSNDLSFESYETVILESDSKRPSILIKEILPYPPLPWDIICRPYYAYHSIESVFKSPSLDHIAHERHFSLLDGVAEIEAKMKFIRYPSWLQYKYDTGNYQTLPCGEMFDYANPHYFVYDFFNIPWTAFLVYPFSAAYSKELIAAFDESKEENE